MGTLELKPDEIIARWYHETKVVQPGSVADLMPYFFYVVELDPAYRFGDLIRLLDQPDAALLGTILGEHVVPLLEEARRELEPEPDDEGIWIEYLRVYNTHEDGRLLREFDGWGHWLESKSGAREKDSGMREGAIAVELTPLVRLLDLPLRYERALVFRDEEGEEEYRTEIEITLIELLKAIFYELTFFGTPQERDAMREDLRERVRQIDAGEVELIPAEGVFREVEERLGRIREAEEP